MYKVYNTQEDIAISLSDFFLKTCKSLSKVHLNILPYIIIGMIDSESIVTNDIIKKLKGSFQLVKNESNQRRLRKFFNSHTFDIYMFFDSIIRHVISNFNPRPSDSIHIAFDHCFCKNKFTMLVFSLRLGKQSIPLWFRCFNGTSDPNAFSSSIIIEGIDYVSSLFKHFHCHLVFLADRFFLSHEVMSHFKNSNHTYIIRARYNFKILIFDKKERHNVRKNIGDIIPYARHSSLFYDIPITRKLDIKVNIAISKSNDVDEPWLLVTNGDPKKCVKFYSYRWSIECFFKNIKSNGFYLESTNVRNLNAFSCLFGLACVSSLWLFSLGSYYSRNKGRKKAFITDVKRYKGVPKRFISLFNLGLIYFNLAYYSIKDIFLKCNFIIHDV